MRIVGWKPRQNDLSRTVIQVVQLEDIFRGSFSYWFIAVDFGRVICGAKIQRQANLVGGGSQEAVDFRDKRLFDVFRVVDKVHDAFALVGKFTTKFMIKVMAKANRGKRDTALIALAGMFRNLLRFRRPDIRVAILAGFCFARVLEAS